MIKTFKLFLEEKYHTIPVYHKDKSGKDTTTYWNGPAKSKSIARDLAKAHVENRGGTDISFGK